MSRHHPILLALIIFIILSFILFFYLYGYHTETKRTAIRTSLIERNLHSGDTLRGVLLHPGRSGDVIVELAMKKNNIQ